MSISFTDTIRKILSESGFAALTWQQLVMICCGLCAYIFGNRKEI